MKPAFCFLIVACLCVGQPALCSEADSEPPSLSDRLWSSFENPPGIYYGAQSDDGILWLSGYTTGLYRFDGTRFTSYVSPAGSKPIPRKISVIQSWPNAGVWVGSWYGEIIAIQGNHLTEYTQRDGLPGGTVFNIFRDRTGTIWAATRGGVARLQGARWERVPLISESHEPFDGFQALFDPSGTLWVFSSDRLYSRAPGQELFRESASLNHVFNAGERSVALSADGDIWLTDISGLTRISTRPNVATLKVPDIHGPLLFDREGNLWLGSWPPRRNLLWLSRNTCKSVNNASEVQQQLKEVTTLTGKAEDRRGIVPVLEDREGNMWATGADGLHRFSRSPFTLTRLPGNDAVTHHPQVAVDGTGTLWASVGFLDHSQLFDIVAERPGAPRTTQVISVSFVDRDGTLWFGGSGGISHFIHGEMDTTSLPASIGNYNVVTLLRDSTGALWVTVVRKGLFRYFDGAWIKNGGYSQLPEPYPFVSNTDASGTPWFGYANKVARIKDGAVQLFSAPEGRDLGNTTAIQAGAHTWIAGELNLMRFDGQRLIPMLGAGGQSFRAVSGIVETRSGDLWLYGALGIAYIEAGEISRFLTNPGYQPHYKLFDQLDGVPAPALGYPVPTAVSTTDGRLWFASGDIPALISINPERISRNLIPPPVKIWSVTTQGHQYDVDASTLELPVHTTALQIEYTAGSLTAPERVRFRYKLDGLDKDWQDGGSRRDTFYTNMPPGPYTFHVTASNNDGVWNEVGASLHLTIMPAWYQTRWFYALCSLVALAALAGLYRARLGQVRADTRRLMEARLSERERIARDLHDTLLQSMQGLMLRFRAATNAIPDRERSRDMMERALGRAEQVIVESRDKVKEIRAEDKASLSLPDALAAFASQFEDPSMPPLRLTVVGDPVELHPLVREEALLVSREALANAFLHANADSIEVELSYGSRALNIRIRDDGAGISPEVMSKGRDGHWGLAGMRERARKIQGRLDIWSTPGAGTEVELVVPAAIAYCGRAQNSQLSERPVRGLPRRRGMHWETH